MFLLKIDYKREEKTINIDTVKPLDTIIGIKEGKIDSIVVCTTNAKKFYLRKINTDKLHPFKGDTLQDLLFHYKDTYDFRVVKL